MIFNTFYELHFLVKFLIVFASFNITFFILRKLILIGIKPSATEVKYPRLMTMGKIQLFFVAVGFILLVVFLFTDFFI